MSSLTLIIIIGVASSFFASIVTVAAAMMSSRISQNENILEEYDSPSLIMHRLPDPIPVEN